MSKQKRSRALLRNLRKQARQGTLSARERRQLASQEKKFRKARKSTAKGVGAGLAGAAALLATPAGQRVMSDVRDFRSARADERSNKEKERLEEETGRRLSEGADRIEEAEREEDRQKLLARADEFERRERDRVTAPVTDVDFSMGEEGPTRSDFDAYQRQRAKELGSQVDTPIVYTKERHGYDETYTPGTGGRLPSDDDVLFGRRASLPNFDDRTVARYKMALDAGLNQPDYTGGFETTGQKPEGSPAFERAQRILSGELTGDPRVDFGFDIEDQPEEQDFPNEFFPLDQVYESRERSRRERPGFDPDVKGPMGDGGKVEYGIGGAILAGVNAIKNKEGLRGIANVAKAAATPGSGIAQGAKLAGGLLAGSQNPALAGIGKLAGVASNFMPGGGGIAGGGGGGLLNTIGSLAGGGGGGGALGALGGLFRGVSAEKGMKVAEMKDGGRAANLKKMIAKKYGFR